jgi:Mn-dependent DtxR family transcriptional regulator
MENEFHTVRGYQLLRQNNMMLTSAMEDYLEMIYRSTQDGNYFRINELADKLNVRASSATKMVQKLGAIELINYKKYGVITLSESGKILGAYLLNRHKVIEDFLKIIGINENLLVETELIEHYISPNTVEHLEIFNGFFAADPELLEKLKQYVFANKK